jgi:hypothetical protein
MDLRVDDYWFGYHANLTAPRPFFGYLSSGAQAVMPEISTTSLPLNLPAQKIGANDLISVSVYTGRKALRCSIRWPRAMNTFRT